MEAQAFVLPAVGGPATNSCTICGHAAHQAHACPYASRDKERITQLFSRQSVEDAEEKEFVPLRKKLKRKSTGKEDNFMASYYKEQRSIADLSESDVSRLRLEYGIEVEGDEVPRPISLFSDAGLPTDLVALLEAHGCIEPTPIQMQAIPCVMQGRDVIGIAETGSGKTLAYLLPLLMFLRTKPPVSPGQGPYALVLAPTRELAEQIHGEVVKYSTSLSRIQRGYPGPSPSSAFPSQPPHMYSNLPQQLNSAYQTTSTIPQRSPYLTQSMVTTSTTTTNRSSSTSVRAVLVTGGMPLPSQIEPLASGCEIVIATPGRLLDLISRGAMKMESLSYLVFDEADRMLALEMEVQLREIVDRASMCARQTLLFSATIGDAVMRLVRSAVLNPITIMIGEQLASPQSITQSIVFMHPRQKRNKLLSTLRSIERPPVLIFCNHHSAVDNVVALLKSEQFHVAGLHGEKVQSYRFQVMRAFKEGGLDVLVSTDLAARGIDVKNVSTVILYDMPDTIETYIHRIGRTGRAGQSGCAIGFLTLECRMAADLKKFLARCKQEVPPELQNVHQFGHTTTRESSVG